MKTSLRPISRILIAVSSLLLIPTFFLPIWRIDLWAPQYPEGLVLKIWLAKLSGDVDIINGINHYIGMAHIKEEMFPEFGYMSYIVGFFILFGLLTALVNKRAMLVAYFSMLILAGVAAMYDFWQWAYDYGHNLSPDAAIKVPGMAYQPHLIGYKALLNFGAFSIPDIGGWIVLAVGVIVGGVLAYEYWQDRQARAVGTATRLAGILLLAATAQACSAQPNPIAYGKDACDHCRMTISDQRFAAELVNKNGKAFKFDDIVCLRDYLDAVGQTTADFSLVLVDDFANPGTLIDARQAHFYKLPTLKSPMRGDVGAFGKKPDDAYVRDQLGGATPTDLKTILSK